jgi:beta-lactamase class C
VRVIEGAVKLGDGCDLLESLLRAAIMISPSLHGLLSRKVRCTTSAHPNEGGSRLTVIVRPLRPLALAIIFCALPPAAIRAADSPAKITAAVERSFRPLMKEHDVPGIAVAVTVGGQHHFFSYGVASKERNVPVTKDTLFEVGSVSKTFTATLASYAQTLGKLSLDDHPGKYITQLQGSAIDKASLLNLGTYTAGGLPLQVPEAVTNAGMASYFREWKPSAIPSAQRRYSNPSIGLLGHVTALSMNGDFADLIETEVFPKLGLNHSYIRIPEAEMDNYAWGYNKEGKPVRVNPGVLDAEAYGVKTSAVDLIRFVEANIRPETLDMPMRRAVEGTHIGYFKVGEMVQGLGWEQYPYPVTLDRLLAGNASTMAMEPNTATELTPPQTPSRPTLFNKTGSTNGFGAYVAFVPEKRIGIVMLANKNVPIPARITAAHAVLEQLSSEVP